MRLAQEFRMKLAGEEKGVVLEFDHFNQLAIRRRATEDKACLLKFLAVGIIKLEAMPVTLGSQCSRWI